MNKLFLKSILLCLCVASLVSIDALAAGDRGKAVKNSSLIPRELKSTTIVDYFLEKQEKEVATIEAIQGNAIVARQDLKQAYFAAAGDKLYEKDIIFTLNKSRCKFKLVTEDVVSLGEKAKLDIKKIVDDRNGQSKSSLFGMVRGMAIFYTVHISRYVKQSLDVETPTAVCGVRGSKFGLQIKSGGTKSLTNRPVLLADASDNGFIYLASLEKNNQVTVVHGMEGTVAVKATNSSETKALKPGESIEATFQGLGKIFETPAKVMKQFADSVEINMEKAAKEIDKQGKAVEKKLREPAGALDKWGKDLEKKFK